MANGCQRDFGYTNNELDALERAISVERFSTYVRRAGGNRLAAIRLYEHNTKVSEALFGVIRGLEISLRNSIHDTLRTGIGADNWYDCFPFLLLEETRSIATAKASLNRRRKPITPGRVVAELTFGFWCGLTSKVYDANLWVPHLHKAFPHKRLGRRQASNRLNELRILRNRIAHHECILQPNLQKLHDDLVETVGWICPVSSAWVSQYSSFHALNSITSA